MGTLIGHVGPGFGFFVIGLWHMYNHLKLLAQKGLPSYKSRLWFPCGNHSLLRRLELYLIIVGCSLSVAMELFLGPQKHHPLAADGSIPSNHLHNVEHSSISLTFLVYALFALALDKCVTKPIPAQHEVLQLLAGIAFGQELLMFHVHSADHMGVEGQYHWLLQVVVFVTLVTTMIGGRGGPSRFILNYLRSLSIMFQGVWLMVMGFALWTPSLIPKGCFIHLQDGHRVVGCHGDEPLHRAKALVNIEFSWLLILAALFAALFYVFMMMFYGRNNSVHYTAVSLTHHQKEDEDEDMEDHNVDKILVQTP